MTIDWQAPASAGASAVRYDVLRSPLPSDFGASAVCVESDGTDNTANEPEPAGTWFYLVRVENDCPTGGSNAGTDSAGTPRSGRSCP